MAGVYRVGGTWHRQAGRDIAGAITTIRKRRAEEEAAARKAAEEARKANEAWKKKMGEIEAEKRRKDAEAIVSDPEAMKKLGDDARGLTTDQEQWDIWSHRTPGQRGLDKIPEFRRGGATVDVGGEVTDVPDYRLPSISDVDPITLGRSAREMSDDITRFHENKEDARNRKYIPSIRNPTPLRHGQAGAEQTLAELITRRRAEAGRTLAELSAAGAKGARYEAIRRSEEEQGKQQTQDRVYKPGVQTIEERTTALRMAEMERTNAIKAAAAKEREKALKGVRSGGGSKKVRGPDYRTKAEQKAARKLAYGPQDVEDMISRDAQNEAIARSKATEKALQAEAKATEQAVKAREKAIQKELVAQSKKDIAELLAKGEARKKSLADRYEEVNRPWGVRGRDKGWADAQLKESFAGGDPAIGETLPPHMRSFLGYPPKRVYDPDNLPVDENGVKLPPPEGAVSSEFLKEVASDFESHEKDALNQSWWELAGEQAAYNGTTVREEYLKIREWAENGGVMVEVTENANGTLDATPMSKDHIRDNLKKDPLFVDTGESEVIRGEDGTLYERIGGLNYPLYPVTPRPGEFTGPAMREPTPVDHPPVGQAPGEPGFIPERYNVSVGTPAAYNLPPPTQVFRNLPPRRNPILDIYRGYPGLAPRWART